MARETTEERYLHAMLDAVLWLDRGDTDGLTAKAILTGILRSAGYPPFLRYQSSRGGDGDG